MMRRAFSRIEPLSVLTPLVFCILCRCQPSAPVPAINGDGIRLHYLEQGSGTPLALVHGSLSDGGYWTDQIGPLSEHYHVIAYSRRYNYPNQNPTRAGYCAVTDGEDLASLIGPLRLGKVVVLGHSYRALAALFLAVRHPQLVRAMILAEPPAVSLLSHLTGPEAKSGMDSLHDIQRRMVEPMQQAFRSGDRNAGVAILMDYVFDDPHAWEKMSESSRQETLNNAHEWDVMMTTGTLFPEIDPGTIERITVPTLLLSGAKSYPFLALISQDLTRLLPNRQNTVLPDAGPQMWYEKPEECRRDVENFLGKAGTH